MSTKRAIGDVRYTTVATPDGRWRVRMRTCDQEDGHEASTFSKPYQTRDLAEKVVLAARLASQRQHITLREALEKGCGARRAANQRLRDEELRARAEARVRSFAQNVRAFLKPYLDRPILSFREDDAIERYAHLAGENGTPWVSPHTSKPLSGATLRGLLNDTRLFFTQARQLKLWPRERANPLAEVKSAVPCNTGKDQPTPQERDQLREYCRRQCERAVQVSLKGRKAIQAPVDLDALYVGVLIETGCRPSEILRRRPQDIEPTATGANIQTPPGLGKTDHAVRPIPVVGPVAAALLRLRAARASERWLMPHRSGRCSLLTVGRVCVAAGLSRLVHPYSLRGASISAKLRAAIDQIGQAHGHGRGGAVADKHYLNDQVRAEFEGAQATEHQRQLDQQAQQSRVLAELGRLRQEGLLQAQEGALPILAARLSTVLGPLGTASPAPAAPIVPPSRRDRVN